MISSSGERTTSRIAERTTSASHLTKSGKDRARGVGEGQQRDALELLEDHPRLHVREVECDPGADAEFGAQQEALLELLELAARKHEDDLVHDLVLEDLGEDRRLGRAPAGRRTVSGKLPLGRQNRGP